jgi:hypothetical protein
MGFPQFSLTKSSSSGKVAPGEMLTYSINYKNLGGNGIDLVNLPQTGDPNAIIAFEDNDYPGNWTRDITITESYPSGVTFVSADPAPDPGRNNQWTIKNVTKGSGGTLNVTVRVPEAPANVKFSSQESTSGVGFMRSTKDMTTEIQPYTLINSVGMTYGTIKLQSATNSVTVRGDPGTKLLQRESGSGTYSSEATVNYNRETNYIREVEDLSARYSPTIFDLPQGRSIKYDSKGARRRWPRTTWSQNRHRIPICMPIIWIAREPWS